jgi:hypothetical protein
MRRNRDGLPAMAFPMGQPATAIVLWGDFSGLPDRASTMLQSVIRLSPVSNSFL